MKRNIVQIDEDRCDGCGLCVSACAEGAIQIIDGKARLVSDTYCDGLGACLGHCPQDAIRVIEREAEAFDPQAVEEFLGSKNHEGHKPGQGHHDKGKKDELPCGCPGSMARTIPASTGCPGMASRTITKDVDSDSVSSETSLEATSSRLTNWPVQIKLVPTTAPYLKGADLLIAADCVPFAFAGFHERFVKGRVALVGCPKLDDSAAYIDKLALLFSQNHPRSIEVPYMEVPCCGGLVQIVKRALEKSGVKVPTFLTRISLDGKIMESQAL